MSKPLEQDFLNCEKTYRQIAEECEIDYSTLMRFKNGRGDVKFETYIKIFNSLHDTKVDPHGFVKHYILSHPGCFNKIVNHRYMSNYNRTMMIAVYDLCYTGGMTKLYEDLINIVSRSTLEKELKKFIKRS